MAASDRDRTHVGRPETLNGSHFLTAAAKYLLFPEHFFVVDVI